MADQTFKAKYVQDDTTMDYTPGSAVAGGFPVAIGGLRGITHRPIAASELGALALEPGLYDGAKDTSVFAIGDPVYWSATGSPVGGTASSGAFTSGSGSFFGYAVLAALTGDATVRFRLTQSAGGGAITVALADPGDAGAIPVSGSGYIPIVTAGAETRTLAAPTFVGQELLLTMVTDGGDCVITCATGINQTGNNTITMNDAGDSIRLVAILSGANIRWRVAYNDGCTLATV